MSTANVSSRRHAVPFDPYYFEKLALSGATLPADAIFRDIYRRPKLPRLLHDLGVVTLLDLSCGDFSWMQTIDLTVESYIGADFLPELVHRLNAAHADARRGFMVLDLTRDALPDADLVTTTFPDCQANEDIVTGDWRVLNLEREPCRLPPPLQLLNEGCTEAAGLFADKSLGLWRTRDLASLPFLNA